MDVAFFVSHLDGVSDVEAERLQPFPFHLDFRGFDVFAAEITVCALPCACGILDFHFLCLHKLSPFLLVRTC